MFCCGFSCAIVIAGCHNKISTSVASAACKNQIIPARQPCNFGAARGNRERISHPSPAAAASTAKNSNHFGHEPSRTNWPFENVGAGYLKRNWNIRRTFLDNRSTESHRRGLRCSVRQSVNHVVDADAKSQGSKALRIFRARPPTPMRLRDACCGRWQPSRVLYRREWPATSARSHPSHMSGRLDVLFSRHLKTVAQVI